MTVKCARLSRSQVRCDTQPITTASQRLFGPVGCTSQREWNGGPTREELGYDVLGWTVLMQPAARTALATERQSTPTLQVIAPGSLSGSKRLERVFEPAPAESKTSHRRLHLAKWIVDRENPLTARVIVNRLWQHHFGEGIVRTPDNFGFLGNLPTHPELLDWLAGELMRGDWKLKRIHKLIVMSKTYQQSSLHPEQSRYAAVDSANHFWWRAERRRLESEQLRDAILWCSGRLDPSMGGPSFKSAISDEALEGLSMKSGAYQASPEEATRRRSIYMFAKRSLAVPMMTVFDSCDTTAPIGRRDVSIVARASTYSAE